MEHDSPTVPPPNKIVHEEPYWFFKYTPELTVDVLDNAGMLPATLTPWRGKVEPLQGIKALLRSDDYDAVIAHSYNSAFLLSLIRYMTRSRTPPLFVIDVGCLNGGRERPIEISIIRKALTSVNGVVHHSRVNEEFYKHHFPHLRRKFIHFGTDLTFFQPLSRTSLSKFALSIGTAHRDYSTLVKAWKRVDFPLKIVGPRAFPGEKIPQNVEVIPEVSIAKLRELIHDALLIVLPIANKRYSVGQMTLTQCMAMGKSIVVTNVPGVSDYIKPDENCIAVAPNREDEIADAVTGLIEDAELRERLSMNALRDAGERFDERLMASKISDFVRLQR